MSATNGSTKRNADADPSGDESKVAAKKQRVRVPPRGCEAGARVRCEMLTLQ